MFNNKNTKIPIAKNISYGPVATFSDSTDVFIEAGNHGYMARSGLRGNSGMGDSPPTFFLHHISAEVNEGG